ncbi:MAG: hypothetical protein GDA44_03825 [Prochloron sp. SP5CPC1]|nr:hypothetical protein [Candidatus Paraprochloron terpiosi SP5CPC1]
MAKFAAQIVESAPRTVHSATERMRLNNDPVKKKFPRSAVAKLKMAKAIKRIRRPIGYLLELRQV